LAAALLTPVFMGMTPIFGKQAIHAGIDPYTLAALRTCFAALLLWILFGLFARKYTFIFPAGLIGTIIVGVVNGLGSLMYYNGLQFLDNASLSQLLYMTYVIFAMLLTRIYGQHLSLLSVVRAVLAFAAVYLLTLGSSNGHALHWVGIGLMLGSAFMYALHVVLSQRVMFEMPAQTMTLYTLTFIGATVLVVRLLVGTFTPINWTPTVTVGWWYLFGLTAVTALSRLTLFAGVRGLGGMQAILLNMAEIGVALLAANIWLDERLTLLQWIGVAILMSSVFLSRWDVDISDQVYKPIPHPSHFSGLSPGVNPSPFQMLLLAISHLMPPQFNGRKSSQPEPLPEFDFPAGFLSEDNPLLAEHPPRKHP
jgi:drug/metabolite transporter (DMT)-like permease